jgi:hypothetical protein
MTAGVYVAEVFRCFTAMLLLVAALGKLRTLDEFRHNLTESFGVGAGAARMLAPAIAATELLLAAAIALGDTIASGAALASGAHGGMGVMGGTGNVGKVGGLGGLIVYAAMAATLAMFVVFTALVARKYVQEGIVRCNCFGEAGRSVSPFDLLRNVLVMACIGFYLACAVMGVESSHAAMATITGEAWFLAVGLAALLTVLAVEFHEIAMLLLHSGEGLA